MGTARSARSFVSVRWVVLAILVPGGSVGASQPPEGGSQDGWRTQDRVVQATNRGVAAMERYEYAAAVEAFGAVLGLDEDSAEARVNLAIALFNRGAKGDLQRAEELLDEALGIRQDSARAWYFRGITHQFSGRDKEAVPCFEQTLKLAPHDAHAWYLLARSKAHLDLPCRADLERAIAENPGLVSAHYDLMRLAYQEGNREEARALQERFVTLRQSPLSETVVVPQYQEMGPLAEVRPTPGRPKRGAAGGELTAGPPRTLFRGRDLPKARPGGKAQADFAMADVNEDGRPDLAIVGLDVATVMLLLGQADGGFADATGTAGLAITSPAASCSFGDYDNDGHVDLIVSCAGPNHLFRGRGNGTFEDVTKWTGTAGGAVRTAAATFLDADHDGDLDIFVCNSSEVGGAGEPRPVPNQLLNNNADGSFTDIATSAGVGCPDDSTSMVAPNDVDRDRDTDLVVFNGAGRVAYFVNDRLGQYHRAELTAEPIRNAAGGVVQDFNGDGRPDLLAFDGGGAPGGLYLTDATTLLAPSSQFDECLQALATWDVISRSRVVDLDLDGDLDIALFGKAGHALFNDGWGQFAMKPNIWAESTLQDTTAAEVTDLTGDGLPDLLLISADGGVSVRLVPGVLTPPANWLAVTPTGKRGTDGRTRSPASGFGTRVEMRCGAHSQAITYTGLFGGRCQSQLPMVFGMDGAAKADYAMLVWTDGVTQAEVELTAGKNHRVEETERRVSSCPVLFAWDGERFAFVGDFAGVGGLGYYVAPGEYAAPQVREHVRIQPHQLAPRGGFYELRVCEPMEEVAFIDRLELLVVDHPVGTDIYPDEHLAVTGPPPTGDLLRVEERWHAVRACGPGVADCSAALRDVDRVYAYQPPLDRRFFGFCKPHTLELDFGQVTTGSDPGDNVYLFLTGSIEYPYSQTTFAAAQAGVNWQPMMIERQTPQGSWQTVVEDAGAPGGIGRTMTVDLTGLLPAGPCKLRVTTNLEIYYDQAFLAADCGVEDVRVTSIPVAEADLRRLGFPREYSPDGHLPTIYSYDTIELTSSFKVPLGYYTRYGPVQNLLTEFDDRYVILGTGDEIAVRFDARSLPPVGAGQLRSFVLVSHAYCKDMDLYTAEPDTVEPLPFRGMSQYPYPREQYDAGGREEWAKLNTRLNGAGGDVRTRPR